MASFFFFLNATHSQLLCSWGTRDSQALKHSPGQALPREKMKLQTQVCLKPPLKESFFKKRKENGVGPQSNRASGKIATERAIELPKKRLRKTEDVQAQPHPLGLFGGTQTGTELEKLSEQDCLPPEKANTSSAISHHSQPQNRTYQLCFRKTDGSSTVVVTLL